VVPTFSSQVPFSTATSHSPLSLSLHAPSATVRSRRKHRRCPCRRGEDGFGESGDRGGNTGVLHVPRGAEVVAGPGSEPSRVRG